MKNKLLSQSILYTIGEVIPKVISFILFPIYTRFLTPEAYGILSYTNAANLFLFVFTILCLNTFLMRFYFEQKTEEEKKKLVGNVFLFISLVNTGILLSGFLIAPVLLSSGNLQVPWRPYFQLALINNFLDVFSVVPLVLYRVRQNAKTFVLLSLSKVFFQVAITYWLIVEADYGLIGHYYGKLWVAMPFVLIYWAIIWKNATFKVDWSQIKMALRFSLPLLPGAMAFVLLNFSDRIILERFVNIGQLGLYNVAYTIAFSLTMVIQGGYKAFEPVIYKARGTDNYIAVVKRVSSVYYFAVFVMAMGLSLFGEDLLRIITSESYYEAFRLIPQLLLASILAGVNLMFSTLLTADYKTKRVGVANLIGAAINIGLNFVFIPQFGVLGAVYSSIIGFLSISVFLVTNLEPRQRSVLGVIFLILLFVGVSWGASQIELVGLMESLLLKLGFLIIFAFVALMLLNLSPRSILRFRNA